MKKPNLQEIAQALADELRVGLCSDRPGFFPQLLRLLSQGRPVSPDQLAASLQISRDEVTAALGQMASVEYDSEGNIVGSGVTLTPTPHRFHVGGKELFTWCALDTLLFPAILQEPARVASTCPVTGANIQLIVNPDGGVDSLEPASAVVSIVLPKSSTSSCCDVRGSFCNQVHFFSSAEASAAWLIDHQGAIILSVNEACQLGQMLAEHLFREDSNSDGKLSQSPPLPTGNAEANSENHVRRTVGWRGL